MGFCDKFKVKRVICDEIFYVSHIEEDVVIGDVEIPDDGVINGEVTVTVLDCNPVLVTNEQGEITDIQAEIVVMIQKELTITGTDEQGQSVELPLEFAERQLFTLDFRKCDPAVLNDIDPDLLNDLECQVIWVNGMDDITLDQDAGTFDEELTIIVKLKLVQERQLHLALCPAKNQFEIDVTSEINGNG